MSQKNEEETALTSAESEEADPAVEETTTADTQETTAKNTAENKTPARPPEQPAEAAPSTSDAIKNDPYDFERCQVQVNILFLPRSDGEARMAVCGVKTHDDDPLIEVKPGDEILATLPADIQEMIEKVKTQMPARAMERMAKKQAPAIQKKPKSVRIPTTSASVIPTAPVKTPNAPKLSAPVQQPDLFSMFGGAQ